ncbi:MAG: SpoIID/LytB domain-containing protein [Elusimicrobiales bacterium]
MVSILYLLGVTLAGHGIWHGNAHAVASDPAYYYFHGQPEKALTLYLETAGAGDTAAVINAAIILRELGRNGEAIKILEKALPGNPENPDVNTALGWAYLSSGNTARAGEAFGKAAKKDEKDWRVLLGLAFSRMQAKDYTAAAGYFQKLAENRNLSALACYYLGTIAEETGDASKAVDLYNKALKEDSQFVEVRPLLARIFEEQRRADDAWKQYSKIALMDPAHKLAAEKKKTLLAKLTRKPGELLKVKRIKEFTRVRPAQARDESPEVRIGIGTTVGGNPVYRDNIAFRASGPFSIFDIKTGKELVFGKANETWTITIDGGTGKPCPPPQTPNTGGTGSAPVSNTIPGKGAVITAPDGSIIPIPSGSMLVRQKERGSGTIILEAVSYGPGMAWSGVADEELRGDLEIRFNAANKGLFVINLLPLEEYLYGVIAAEMPAHWPLEALKAQAVIARTYALNIKKTLHPHSALGYDLCDDQHCQVYTGVSVESAKIRSAADLTRDKALAFKGKAIHAVFSSNCGGHTQSGAGAGWASLPYWRSVYDGPARSAWESPRGLAAFLTSAPEVYCKTSKYTWAPEFRWARFIPAEDLIARLARKAAIGKLKTIIFTRGESGRVSSVKFVGTSNGLVLTKEYEIRRLFGLAPLRSTMFTADVFYENGFVKSLLIYGGGWGHAVGLCQSGAAGRAEAGLPYEKILQEYYPGAVLSDIRNLK